MRATLLACLVHGLTSTTTAFAVSLQAISGLLGPGTGSYALSLSANGKAVAGVSPSERTLAFDHDFAEPFRWTSETGTVGLGFIDGFTAGVTQNGQATELSADGNTVFGWATDSTGEYGIFRWTAASGMVQVDIPRAALPNMAVAGVSASGDVLAGAIYDDQFNWGAYRWSQAEGLQILPPNPAAPTGSYASAISADGSVIVGNDQFHRAPFYWTAATGTVALSAPKNAYSTMVAEVSADGRTFIGGSELQNESKGLVWKIDGSSFELPKLDAHWAIPKAVSADGSVIVGDIDSDARGTQVFLWDELHGTRVLDDVLAASGIDLAGWSLSHRTAGISADGQTILTIAISPAGNGQAWVVTVPEPATIGLAATGGALLAIARWRKSHKCRPRNVA